MSRVLAIAWAMVVCPFIALFYSWFWLCNGGLALCELQPSVFVGGCACTVLGLAVVVGCRLKRVKEGDEELDDEIRRGEGGGLGGVVLG